METPTREIFEHQELLDFVMAQPPDRKFDMQRSTAVPGQCGCVLIQFARHKFGSEDEYGDAGYSVASISGKKSYVSADRTATDKLIGALYRSGLHTYGEVQDRLRRTGNA